MVDALMADSFDRIHTINQTLVSTDENDQMTDFTIKTRPPAGHRLPSAL